MLRKIINLIKSYVYAIFLITIICLVGMILLKPDTSAIDEYKEIWENVEVKYKITVREELFTRYYTQEELVPYMVMALVSEEIFNKISDASMRKEYYKALCIICRTNLVYSWREKGEPDILALKDTKLSIRRIGFEENEIQLLKEIREASRETLGVVITDKESGKVIIAPFFTSKEGDLLARDKGNGIGFSLNYSIQLVNEGMDFVEILKASYDVITSGITFGMN